MVRKGIDERDRRRRLLGAWVSSRSGPMILEAGEGWGVMERSAQGV